MKVYQEEWRKRISKATNKDTLREICQEILEDDTGGTDELTIVLVKRLLDELGS